MNFQVLSRLFATLLLVLWLPSVLTAQTQEPSDAPTEGAGLIEGARTLSEELVEVQTGAYIMRLGNVSPRDGSFDVDMWMWFRWQGAEIRPDLSFELANGIITSRTDTEVLNDEGYNYSTMRVMGTIFHDFDVRRYPMDDHVITIDIEDSLLESTRLVYVVDDGIALDPQVMVAGWEVGMQPAYSDTHTYETTYGFRSSGSEGATYSRMTIPISLERTSYGTLFKSFWVSLLAVVLGLLAFLVKADDLDARFGMGVGSIFAASANAFIIADTLPQTTIITLAEQVNLIAVGVIFSTVFISIWSLRLRYAGREEDSLKLDMRALVVMAILYIVMNLLVLRFDFS